MRFGGHETFAIREGWLHKGLDLLSQHPDRFHDAQAADWLGVGRNMAKSIRHWLVASGLAHRPSGGSSGPLALTELGIAVCERDPYFCQQGTWWCIHTNLVNAPEHAASWHWMFSQANLDRFDRPHAVEALQRHLSRAQSRMPSHTTLDRDMACLLASYARMVPEQPGDPEDANECPLIDLGLLVGFRASRHYEFDRGEKDVPGLLFGYCMSVAFASPTPSLGVRAIPIQDVALHPGGPGRAFVLTSEALFGMVSRYDAEMGAEGISIAGLAGERSIRLRERPAVEWLKEYYSSVG